MKYDNIRGFETAYVIDNGDKYQVEFVSISTIDWVTDSDPDNYLPLNSLAANLIRESLLNGKEVYIDKDWQKLGKEVLTSVVSINPITDLYGYKKRAISFIKQFINPQMARTNASTIYGFNVINNKFLEAGFVFSEENRSLKYIEILNRSEELEEEAPEASEELIALLEKYIEYREILDRTYFIWELSETCINNINEVRNTDESDEEILKAKELIDKLAGEFANKVNKLNNTITR